MTLLLSLSLQAAISSTLSHPNIVATYTYSVKPIRDSMMNLKSKKMTQATPGVLIADADGSMIETGKQSLTLASRQSAIHSYEVRLILEFCDRGCLKDAVEAQVTPTPLLLLSPPLRSPHCSSLPSLLF